MTLEWTDEARKNLEAYLDEAVRDAGPDAAELRADLRAHVEQELLFRKVELVTKDVLRDALASIGGPPARKFLADTAPPTTAGFRLRRIVAVFGVAGALACLGVEWYGGSCREHLIDPIPTIGHVALILLVPIALCVALFADAGADGSVPRRAGLGVGYALAITLYYAICFLPAVPIGVGLLLALVGVFLLTPPLAFAATAAFAVHLSRRARLAGEKRLRGFREGFVVGVALLVWVDGPRVAAEIGLSRVASEGADLSNGTVRWLRWFADERAMLDACKTSRAGARSRSPLGLWIRFGRSVSSPEEARVAYFRATGRSFHDAVPSLWQHDGFDGDQGSSFVGVANPDLRVGSSRLDGWIDAEAALGYFEWTLTFENRAEFVPAEARVLFQLPAGSVVSRLTLWVGGEEREAAYADRVQVRDAYRNVVVQQRRDPALVTTQGADRVLLQCFPVPPGGQLKSKVGVTVPLAADEGEARVQLPALAARNCVVPGDLRHEIWIDSKTPPSSSVAALRVASPSASKWALQGSLTSAEMGGLADTAVVRAPRPPTADVWCKAPALGSTRAVRCELRSKPEAPLPSAAVVVVDGSRSLRERATEIASALESIGSRVPLRVFFASEEGTRQLSDRAVAAVLRSSAFVGGCDNVPALAEAWDFAARDHAPSVVWICGPQPVRLSSVESLLQRWDRRPEGPELVCMQVEPGLNFVLNESDGRGRVRSASRRGTIAEDLAEALGLRTGPLIRRWSQCEVAEAATSGKEVSANLARLMADERVRLLLATAKPERIAEARKLASDFRLVTPLTGAVVLETQAQYVSAGLTPAEAITVSSGPEPEAWLLAAIAAAVLLLAVRARRSA